MELKNDERTHRAVHVSGHAVCGYMMGGELEWVAIERIGVVSHLDEIENPFGNAKCDFPEPLPLDPDYSSKSVECWEKQFRQKYAGMLAEEIIFGERPKAGHENDYEWISWHFEYLVRLLPTQTLTHLINVYKRKRDTLCVNIV